MRRKNGWIYKYLKIDESKPVDMIVIMMYLPVAEKYDLNDPIYSLFLKKSVYGLFVSNMLILGNAEYFHTMIITTILEGRYYKPIVLNIISLRFPK